MKAFVLHDINNLHLEEVGKPRLKEEEVLVRVEVAGICGSDISRIFYTGAYSYPLTPGHEFSGCVVEVGKDVDHKWINKRVGIFPLMPCKKCRSCQNGYYEMCRSYSYLGSRTSGGFAEYVTVPEWNLIELPDSVSFEVAAMMEPMAVAVHAMRSIMPRSKDYIFVYGLGTIGILLTMFLRDAGFHNLFVIGNKVFQRETVLRMGILEEKYCDCREQDVSQWVSEKTNDKGADVFFECVGRNETIANAILNTACGGRVQLIGNPASDICLDKNIYWKILRNQLTVKGSWNSTFTHDSGDDWHYVIERLKEKRIAPEQFISHRFSLEELGEGLQIMKDKTEDYIKIMMVN